MSRGRGRLAALAAFAAALAVAAVALCRPAEEWWHIRRLRSEDEAVRRRAAEALGEMRSSRAIPCLLEAGRRHRAGNDQLPDYVRAALERIAGPADREVLVAALRDEDPAIRQWAALTIHEVIPSDERLFGLLSTHCGRAHERADDFAWPLAASLPFFGRRAVPLLEGLLEEGGERAQAAGFLLLGLGPNARQALPAALQSGGADALRWFRKFRGLDALLAEDLRREVEIGGEERRLALRILSRLRIEGRPMMRALRGVLAEGGVEERFWALWSIGNGRREEAEECLPELQAALADSERAVRWPAARALLRLGARDPAVLRVFLEILPHSTDIDLESERFWEAYRLLELVQAAPAGAGEALADALSDPAPEIRAWAACLLARLDPGNETAPRVLSRSLVDRHPLSLQILLRAGMPDAAFTAEFAAFLAPVAGRLEQMGDPRRWRDSGSSWVDSPYWTSCILAAASFDPPSL
jgi:HEAT repeat protein